MRKRGDDECWVLYDEKQRTDLEQSNGGTPQEEIVEEKSVTFDTERTG